MKEKDLIEELGFNDIKKLATLINNRIEHVPKTHTPTSERMLENCELGWE